MSYAIFRVEPINKLKDLGQIGAHNTRTKEAYKSNPDIDKSKSVNNIHLVSPLHNDYYNSYMYLVKDYKKQHDEKQKTERENRKKSFSQMLDDSNSVIADELLFTSDKEFFKDMAKDEIVKWANCCMDFVYEDIGYEKWQVLNATIHLDEKTPHLHCVVIPLIKKYDKRSDKEKWTISKKHYMKDKNYLSILQDKYHERMINNGYDLDRGIKNSDNEHIDIKQYKKITRKLNIELTAKNDNLISYIKVILKAVKDFFRHLLQIGNEKAKEATTIEIKDYYDNNDFDKDDIYDIAIDTTKEDELFDYADIDKFYTKENSFSDLER